MNQPARHASSPSSLRRIPIARTLLCALAVAGSAASPALAQTTARDFAELSLEELMNETVTSVSKREQPRFDAASAISVVTADDIARSGATTIADALRIVPGMSVGSVNSSQWAISARGFTTLYSNKLLVLVDGRTVYTPLFGGVNWDSVQTILEDIDRVEVIRGPGATIWGANAVNGVINVVTRSARDTQGGLLYGGGGDIHEAMAGMRYGDRLGDRTYYRVFAGAFSKDDYLFADGRSADDGWQGRHGGFRVDHHADNTHATWQAATTTVETDDDNTNARAAHTLGRVTHTWSDRSSLSVQAYFDHTDRDELQRGNVRENTIDFTAEHSFGIGERNDIIWGVGYRLVDQTVRQSNPIVEVLDGDHQAELFSIFAQDEFQAIPDKLTLTAGVKIEHHDTTGIEIQPSVRAVLKPTTRQTLWAAASRAVHPPSTIEGKTTLAGAVGPPFPGPGGLYIPKIVGNPDLSSEALLAYELGYRIQLSPRVSADLALFYHDYENLAAIGGITRFVPGVPVGTAEIPFVNSIEGATYGGEVSLTLSPSDDWHLTGAYSLLLADLHGPPATTPEESLYNSSRHQALLRSSHDVTDRFGIDAQLRYVGRTEFVPAYLTADLRLSYHVTDTLQFSLVGQNLLDPQHPEQGPNFLTTTSEVPRGFYGKVTWRF